MKRGNIVYHLLERNVAIRDCIVPGGRWWIQYGNLIYYHFKIILLALDLSYVGHKFYLIIYHFIYTFIWKGY
jgi:hypothetical protein